MSPTKIRLHTPNPIVFGFMPFQILYERIVIGIPQARAMPNVGMANPTVPMIINMKATISNVSSPVLGYI
jgi:hypothetical protein